MTEKYIFSLDYPFKTEPQIKNIIWFGAQISRRDMDLAYRYRSSVFDGAFKLRLAKLGSEKKFTNNFQLFLVSE